MIVTIDDGAYLGSACDTADIVVTPIRMRLERCRLGAKIFTDVSLTTTGAVEMVLSDNPSIETAFPTIRRLWSLHRAFDWRSGAFAATATLSPVSDNGGSSPQASPEP
jgi:hypothetical protein